MGDERTQDILSNPLFIGGEICPRGADECRSRGHGITIWLCVGFAALLIPMTKLQGQSVPLEAPPAIAIIDYRDAYTYTKGLAQSLDDLGYPYVDLSSGILAGGAVDLTGYDTFIIGSFCTQNATVRAALNAAQGVMRAFVENGNTLIMLTQADQDRAEEPWIVSPALVVRGDSDFDTVWRIHPDHQLFNKPQVITDANLTGWRYLSTSVTSWESFSVFDGVVVLAGDHAMSPGLGTIIETGWGRGRAILTSLAIDKARNVGNAQAAAQARRLLENLIQYADDVRHQKVADLEIPQPITGKVFEDLNGNNSLDPGEPGIVGVGVSDGVNLVQTDSDGQYALARNGGGDGALIYISIPAGYAKTATWYRHVPDVAPNTDVNFGLQPVDETGPFDFVQVSDIHVGGGGTRAGLIDALAGIGGLRQVPAFIVATGDLVDVGSSVSQWNDYVNAVATSAKPVFSVIGNHDLNANNLYSADNYWHYVGPDHYSFSYGDGHFVMLNTMQRTAAQSRWLETDLARIRGNKRLFIFQHYSPTYSEYIQYNSYRAEAVFSGHWHSQRTTAYGNLRSYNSPTLLMGGIDASPAGFKVISVANDGLHTRMRYLVDGQRIQIVHPNDSAIIGSGDLRIAVNAYETSAEVNEVAYVVKQGQDVVAGGSLTRDGDWTWLGTVASGTLPAGRYTLAATAINDRGQSYSTSTGFEVTTLGSPLLYVGSSWPQMGEQAQRGALAADATISPPLGLMWVANTGGTIDFASPVLKGNTLYLGVKDRGDFVNNGVLALDAVIGSQRWRASTPAAVSNSVAVDDNRAYVCSQGGFLHAYDINTGSLSWETLIGSSPVDRWLFGSPVVWGDRVYAGAYGYFAAYENATGRQQWHTSYAGALDWQSCDASPVADGSIVILPTNASNVGMKVLSTSDGGELWSHLRALQGSPVIAGDRIVIHGADGKVVVMSKATGDVLWSASTTLTSTSTPAIDGNTLVVGSAGRIRAYRLDNGAVLWNINLAAGPLRMAPSNPWTSNVLVGSPAIANGIAYVPCGNGRLYAIRVATGEVVWSMNFGVPIISQPCISGNAIYLTTYDGHVYALADLSAYCNDDNACTQDIREPVSGECLHVPISCDDNDLCTIDSCDPHTGCVHEPVDCDDHDACTQDACDPQTGQCVYSYISCDDGNLCTIDSCDSKSGCVYAAMTCDDGDPQTTDICQPVSGQCIHRASPEIVEAASVKTHGGAGVMSLNVRGLSSPAVECRSGGPTMIVVTFDRPIMALSGDGTRDVQLSSGQVTGEIVDGIQLSIFLANVADANTLFIMFPGIVNPVDYSPVGQALCFRVLAGDVNGDGRTNSLDLLGVRKNINQITTATTLKTDVNADGLINVFDLLIVRNSLNRLTVGVCP